MIYQSTNVEDGARLDIKAHGFWGPSRECTCTFFDVRVFNPFADSNNRGQLVAVYRRHESEKRRHYEELKNFASTCRTWVICPP